MYSRRTRIRLPNGSDKHGDALQPNAEQHGAHPSRKTPAL
jgi:hypothetical protein